MTISVEIARELRYELGMVEFTHGQLSEPTRNDANALSAGMLLALVESFIAHARLMDDFLGGQENARRDDIVAVRLTEQWEPRGFLTTEDRERANKQVLHFTTRRRRRERWPIHAIARALAHTYLEFYALLEPDDQHELEGTAISARAIIERCDSDRVHEINLGLVWEEPGEGLDE